MSENSTPNIIFTLKYEKYSKDRNPYYSCKHNGKKRNIVEYIQGGAEERLNIVDYTGNKEKSSGAFDRKGLMNDEKLEKVKQHLRKTHSPIWHGVISFKEKFGEEYMRCYEDAYNLMKTQLPKFMKSAGLDYSNIVWFAGMHQNTEHRHIHLVFYERRGTHKRKGKKVLQYSKGKLPPESFAEFKFNMESWLLGTWKKVIRSWDNIVISGKEGDRNIALYYAGQIQRDIVKLSELLPKEGRLSYNSENMDGLRPFINEMIRNVINGNKQTRIDYRDFCNLLNERDDEIRDLCERYGLDPTNRLTGKKIHDDLFARMGNGMIALAKDYRSDIAGIEQRRSGRIATKHIRRRRLNKLLSDTLELLKHLAGEPDRYFEEYMRKLRQYESEKENERELDGYEM